MAELSDALTLEALASRGEATALVKAEGEALARVSYAELAGRAADLGEALSRAGVRRGERVGILSAGRSFDEPLALVGVLAVGAVAVPLDPSSPPPRLELVLREAGARAVVCDGPAAAKVEGCGLPLVVLGEDGRVETLRKAGAGAELGGFPDESLALVLFTSGSTGVPKAVPVRREGLSAFTTWAAGLVGLGSSDRVLRVAELVFDLSLFDHVATLRAGATLALMSRREAASARSLEAAFSRLGPTVVYGVPSLFMKLGAKLPSLRAVLFAGEVFPPRELRRFAELLPEGARLFNLYGPTETNVCTFHEVDRASLLGQAEAREVPIGKACPYAACELVDEDGVVLEGPGTGELRVSGPTTVGGGPFLTRDRVERGEDGLFYFRGRLDRMLKVRGYRVDPGEVEAALAKHPAVRQAAVLGNEDPRLGKVLRAVVALSEGAALESPERELRAHVASLLPPYMVPERIELRSELPRTSTGKTDYRAL